MFKVNDHVMYGLTGACRIIDIATEVNGSRGATEYYVLEPVYEQNMTIRIPVSNKNLSMRPVITAADVDSLIAAMPTAETVWIEDPRKRSESYKAAIRSGNHEELVKIIKTLYLEREARLSIGRKLPVADSYIIDAAEKQLYQEIALVLNISPDEVISYIAEHVPPAS